MVKAAIQGSYHLPVSWLGLEVEPTRQWAKREEMV
jgi:hypothetical protein